MTKQYTELTDSQWDVKSVFLYLKHRRAVKLRAVVNVLMHMLLTGCQWRNMPVSFPQRRAVNY